MQLRVREHVTITQIAICIVPLGPRSGQSSPSTRPWPYPPPCSLTTTILLSRDVLQHRKPPPRVPRDSQLHQLNDITVAAHRRLGTTHPLQTTTHGPVHTSTRYHAATRQHYTVPAGTPQTRGRALL